MKEVPESRSLKRTHKKLAKAAAHREDLLAKGKLSLPSGEGILSIIVSGAPDHKTNLSPEAQHMHFMEEAERIKGDREPQHQEVRIRPRAVPLDIKMELADPEVTDVVMIGHGSIGALWADGRGGKFDWEQVARNTDYLKQGSFEQRMCGNFPLAYNVPLGTFALSTLSKLTAAPNIVVPNIHPDDDLFVPVYNDVDGVRQQIHALNEKHSSVPPLVVGPHTTTEEAIPSNHNMDEALERLYPTRS
ncbi:hypothetical protein KC963_01670 [Candidatus Saccharibacteria bacterium]|nr:hypothetical protein [Candidatus Saccharibacteria bacterium]